MRLLKGVFGTLSLLGLLWSGNLARAEDDFPLPHLLHNLHSAADMACHWEYGENHLTNDDGDKLKYYCSRLQHPGEWLQDTDWWQNHLPDFVQARRVPVSSVGQRIDADCSSANLPCASVRRDKELEAHFPPGFESATCASAPFLSDQWLQCLELNSPNIRVGPNEKELKALEAAKHAIPHFEKY